MWNASEHDGVRRHSDGLCCVHLDSLQCRDVPCCVGGQCLAVQQHDLAHQVAVLGGEMVLVSHGAGRLVDAGEAGGVDVDVPELPAADVLANAMLVRRGGALGRHRDLRRGVAAEVDQQ